MKRSEHSARQFGMLCVTAALAGLTASAAAQPTAGYAPATSQTAGEVGVLSGGIGEAAQEEMKRAAKDYNVHLVFSNPRGEYLADVPYAVSDARGRQVASGTSDGPLLYLRLPPGSYNVAAQLGESSVTKRIKAPANRAGAEINLILDER